MAKKLSIPNFTNLNSVKRAETPVGIAFLMNKQNNFNRDLNPYKRMIRQIKAVIIVSPASNKIKEPKTIKWAASFDDRMSEKLRNNEGSINKELIMSSKRPL